jgi:hypothetical protein
MSYICSNTLVEKQIDDQARSHGAKGRGNGKVILAEVYEKDA